MSSSVNLSDGFPAKRTEVRQVCGQDSAPLMTVEMAIFRPTPNKTKQKKHRKGSINTELVRGVGQALSEGEHEGADGTMTTTYTYDNTKFQRAVFEMKFDWAGVDPPSKPDWGLKANPCWPQGIVPNDPGYVLVANDKWYDNPLNPDYRKSYSEPPPNDLAAQAKISTGGKRPGSPNNNSPNPLKQTNTGPGGQKRALGIIEDGFVIRDVNLTRRLTDEVIKQNVEVLDCADRICSTSARPWATTRTSLSSLEWARK